MRKRHSILALCGAVLCLGLIGCSGPPALTAVAPATGYPRQLLAVDGDTLFASVVWDAGAPGEINLANGMFGTSYFQIPASASAGVHDVAIRNSKGTSSSVQVEVLAPQDFRNGAGSPPYFPAPRIEDIGILFAAARPLAMDFLLTVSAANLDVDATMSVSEIVDKPETPVVEGPAVSRGVLYVSRWGGLPVDYLQHHKPSTFGYPIYHYAQLIGVVEGVTPGALIEVTVTNTDAKTSTMRYKVPADLSSIDSDGDGLLDAWEDASYTAASGGNVPLAVMGTKRWRKDLLLEIDWTAAAQPDNSVWAGITATFANAPVLNPDGSQGVNIIIDHGQGGGFSEGGQTLGDHDCLTLDFPAPPGNPSTPCPTITSLFTYKATNFNADRKNIFHYAVFGKADVTGATGYGERYGNDFYVTVATQPLPPSFLPSFQLYTLIHELGHNLGFSHGDLLSDDQNVEWKANLPSVMSYRTAPPLDMVSLDPGRLCGLIGKGILTYSQGTLRQIVESTVDETVGWCDGIAADLNFDFDTTDVGAVNMNEGTGANEDYDTADTWDDFDQWGNLRLDFTGPESHWKGD